MKIPALDLKRQIAPIRQELDAAIKGVIDNTSFILGQGVLDFEQSVVKYSGSKYAVGVSNGTVFSSSLPSFRSIRISRRPV